MAVTCGIDIGGTKALGVAADADGTLLPDRLRAITPRTPRDLVATARSMVSQLEGSHGPVTALGVGMAGLVRTDGTFTTGPHLAGLANVDVEGLLARELGVEVRVDNDANCATVAEARLGAARGAAHAVVVSLGTGIGAGLIVDGQLLRGANGFAGEPGHHTVVVDGEPCPCGRRGCWERYASGTALGRRAQEEARAGRAPSLLARVGGHPDELRGEVVTTAAMAGDPEALELVAELAGWVALGLVGIVNLVDPKVIVLGGGLGALGDLLLDPVRDAFDAQAFGRPSWPTPPIVTARFGEAAGALGAALLFDVARTSASDRAR